MKKRLFLTMILFLFGFSAYACDMLTTASTTTTFLTSSTPASTTTSQVSTTTSQTTSASTESPIIPSNYSTLQDEIDVVGIPATGNVKVLVFVVEFSDYPKEDTGVSVEDIELAFNGSSSNLDYESLNSYYLKSSFNQLNITADVFGYYMADYPASYYADEYEKLYAWDYVHDDWLYGEDEVTYPDSDLIYELLSNYAGDIDYSQYDQNNDSYIDGIYVIYSTPVSYESGSDLWWAYQDIYIYEGDTFQNKEPYYFAWAGTDFFLEGNENLNARTIIHETGHMLGLDDYYDYDSSDYYNSGGLGGADMMDNTVGDHNPFSKILLGWITPLVVTESMTVDIAPFLEDGEVILLIDEWNNTIFDEYLLISYYTPTGLNELDKYDIFSTSGIIIYHISAEIDQGYDDSSSYYSIFNYNNTDTNHKLIEIIEADMDNDIFTDGYAENSDLYQASSSFVSSSYPSFDWYSTLELFNFTIHINSIGNTIASISIDFDSGN
ncbi:MAG: hypothetical protein KJ971_02755 [Firmicutes bacterium]|nr:hypothetical protein [Bacillota bacterium]